MTHLDPVCGMTIEEADAVGTHRHDGVTYYFCHPSCLERFKADPKAFLEPAATTAAPPPPGATFICPMDPEVQSSKPGACPKCGMALEPDLSNPAALTRVEYTSPCIRKSSAMRRDPVRSAAWRSSRARSRCSTRRTPSSST